MPGLRRGAPAYLSLLMFVLSPRTISAGQHDARPLALVHATRTSSPVTIDGVLDDEVWRRAAVADGFTQRDPDEGQPPTERTELRVAYDDDALYVGARLYDRDPARIVRRLARRDQNADADSFTIYLDPHHDHLTGVRLTVTAAGVQADAILYNDTWEDPTWDAVWVSAVRVDEEGWTLEMRIPYSQLRFSAANRHTWGLNAARYLQRRNESSWLQPVPKTESGVASRMAHLTGIDGITPRRDIELLPYTVARAEAVAPARAADPFNDGSRLFASAGLDLKYGLTRSLTLTGTVNPDFGQVEVDPAVVNLSAFETFFEEKRPFFVEGSQIFSDFGVGGASQLLGYFRVEPQIFYTRRIGRAPQGAAAGDFVDLPRATTILGAAKLTGKTRRGWSLGLLEAVTGREHARIVNGVSRSEAEVEPLTSYFVGRAHRAVGRGAFGLLATAVNRDLRAPALRDRLTSQAYVVGGDGHLFLDARRDWVVTGRFAASSVRGSAAAIERVQRAPHHYYQRPDAPHVELNPRATSLGGWTGTANLNRNSGVHGLNAAVWFVSPGFEVNDLGFVNNGDRDGGHVAYVWRNPALTRLTRRRQLTIGKWWTWNAVPELQGDGMHAAGGITLRNYWDLNGGVSIATRVWDDKLTRGGPDVIRPGNVLSFLSIASDVRRKLSLRTDAQYTRREFGGEAMTTGTALHYKPSPSVSIIIGPQVRRDRAFAQYVRTVTDPAATDTYGARYVFAGLNLTEVSMPTRLNVVLSPDVSLQMYTQPFISVGDYRGFKELARPRSYDFSEYGRHVGQLRYDPATRVYDIDPGPGAVRFRLTDPDFNFKSLRLNAVVRWEWQPGSTMFLVWQQQRQDATHPGDFGIGRDTSALFTAAADDVVMLKIAWWIGR